MSAVSRFKDQNVVILGLARQGLALTRFMIESGARVTVSDLRHADQLTVERAELSRLEQAGAKINLLAGEHPLSMLDGCDLLCISGGVPLQSEVVQEARLRHIPLSNDALLTLQQLHLSGLGPTVAITGSSGKTTTSTLVARMLAAAGYTVHLGGNIGTPLLDRLHGVQPGDFVVLELSSFQLEVCNPAIALGPLEGIGPTVAGLLNITPNHLDRHRNMAEYAGAKLRLLKMMGPENTLVVNADDPVTARFICREAPGSSAPLPAEWNLNKLLDCAAVGQRDRRTQIRMFSKRSLPSPGGWLDGSTLMLGNEEICDVSELKIRGEHNIGNVLAAATIGQCAGVSIDAVRRIVTSFEGVAHRLEVVSNSNGVLWVNDSIATSPERALAGLHSFDENRYSIILLAGGQDKNLSWQSLADAVLEKVRYLIGFGACGPDFVQLVRERKALVKRDTPSSATAQKLEGAVELAARLVASEKRARPAGEVVVLLSPGGTSYDAYKDFEERGEHFRHLVQTLAKQTDDSQ